MPIKVFSSADIKFLQKSTAQARQANDTELATPDLFTTDAPRAEKLGQSRATTLGKIVSLEENWLALTGEYEKEMTAG